MKNKYFFSINFGPRDLQLRGNFLFNLVDCSMWISLQGQGEGGPYTLCLNETPSGHLLMFTKLFQTLASGRSSNNSWGQVVLAHPTNAIKEGVGNWSPALELIECFLQEEVILPSKVCWRKLGGEVCTQSNSLGVKSSYRPQAPVPLSCLARLLCRPKDGVSVLRQSCICAWKVFPETRFHP